MKIGFIGAGKVGFSLGKFLTEGKISVTGYYSRHPESAREAAEFTGTHFYDELGQIVAESDVLFLTVPDGEISSVYRDVKRCEIVNKQICHCSGAMSASVAFPDIAEYGAHGLSIHPLFPISSKYESYRELSGAFFCLEGEEEYLNQWEQMLVNLGVCVRRIEAKDKVRYHAGCVMASNLVCALIQESVELLMECGFGENEAIKALSPLILSNIRHVTEAGPMEAFTGPMERCDASTIAEHLSSLNGSREEKLYRAASERLMEMAMLKHPDRDYSQIADLLREQ